MTPTPRSDLLSIPNQLTLSRLGLSAVLFVLIAVESWVWCLVVFGIAALTDWLDGYLARRLGQASALGRSLDPLIDKVLTCGAFIFLLPRGIHEGWLVPWMVTVVVARELIITGLRGYLESQGARFGADWLGKLKMGLQCAALLAIFMALQSREWLPAWFGILSVLCLILIYAMLLATLASGLQYLWRAVVLLGGPPAPP